MSIWLRLKVAWRAFRNPPSADAHIRWPGYCLEDPRCILDAGHEGTHLS